VDYSRPYAGLGIGANAAIFSVVRAVLLRPLANRDEDRLLYLRQSAPGIGQDNATFSVPEIQDIGSGLKSIKELGTFSEIDFTSWVSARRARFQRAWWMDNYFEVMGLHPVLGRLLTPADDGPNAAGAVVLTYHFWRTSLHSDPSVIGKTVRLESHRRALRDRGWCSGTIRSLSGGRRRSSPISSPARIIFPPRW
jgi:putative ABC transport system permease protein